MENHPSFKVVESLGEIYINKILSELRQFAIFNSLKITNVFFKSEGIHKYNKAPVDKYL